MVGLVEQHPHLFDTTLAENLRIGRRSATDERADGARWPGWGWATGSKGCPRDWPRPSEPWGDGSREASASGWPWPVRCWPTSPSWCSTSRPNTSSRPRPTRSPPTLLALTDGRATLLITHRLAGLEAVDEIVVLDGGRVVERGTARRAPGHRRPLRRPVVGRTHERPARRAPPARGRRAHLRRPRRERPTVNLDLARWQFASTSIYHFLFVPITIGLAFLVALLETGWYRNGDATYLRLGALLRRAAADQRRHRGGDRAHSGVRVRHELVGRTRASWATSSAARSPSRGWLPSSWNRPSSACGSSAGTACPNGRTWPASGWCRSGRCSPPCSSWRPTPGCSTLSATRWSTASPQLTNIFALFTNPVFLWGFTHVVLASLVTGALDHAGGLGLAPAQEPGLDAFRRTAVISLVLLVLSTPIAMFVGSELGVVEGTYQPMKIAAAEALWNSCPGHCRLLRLPDRRGATTT